jgi:hypothetical protein
VENEKRRFEAYLQDMLESFAARHVAHITTRIPKEVRAMTLREFGKHGGTVAACVQALCKQRIAAGEPMGLEKKRCILLLVSCTIFDSFGRLGSGKPRSRKELTKSKHALRRIVRV